MQTASSRDCIRASKLRTNCTRSRAGFRSRPRSRQHVISCSSTSTAPATDSSTAATGIVTRLVGQQILHLDASRSVVPLLSPSEHQLPFAAALVVHHDITVPDIAAFKGQLPVTSHQPLIQQQQQQRHQHSSLVELSYILSGSGYFTSRSNGITQHATAGDSILALLGDIEFSTNAPLDVISSTNAHAAAATGSSSSSAICSDNTDVIRQHKPPASRWNVTPQRHYIQQGNEDPYHHHHHHQQQQQQQLVMLQLLLPRELLTGELDHYQPSHLEAVSQQLPWANATFNNAQQTNSSSNSSSSSSTMHCISQESICELLTGAANLQQQQQQQVPSAPTAPSTISSREPAFNPLSPLLPHQHSPSGGSSSSTCVKRALSEVSAFQLPDQTNRLALLFGPHATPAVCISFGVEVFEPGHVTPIHIHSNAHELFFVLAGEGEGVFGPENNRQRMKLSAGDVAVFPPGVLHGLDNASDQQLYCLQMMLPNESFVEWVRSGQAAGALDVAAVQQLAAAASCGAR